jgi:hypothetical protein
MAKNNSHLRGTWSQLIVEGCQGVVNIRSNQDAIGLGREHCVLGYIMITLSDLKKKGALARAQRLRIDVCNAWS